MATAYRSVSVETWLWGLIIDLPTVVSTFDDRITMDRLTPGEGVAAPYLEIVRHPGSETIRPMQSTGKIVAETFVFDIIGWDDYTSTSRILTAMRDIDAAIMNPANSMQDGYKMVTDDLGEIPPADQPRPGEPISVRLGKMYQVSALGGP